MSKNATPEETMGELHAKVAEVLSAQLEGRPYKDPKTGEVLWVEVDPRFVTAAVTFLNNNKVTMSPFVMETISEIEKKLKSRAKFTLIKKEAEEDARKAAGLG
jgi:hypothetical protein